MRKLLAFLTTVLLLGLVACSPGGAPSGGPVAANYAGYWVVQLNTSFYKLRQFGAEVTGKYYHTLGNQALGSARYVYECGILGGKVNGRTLDLEIISTRQNCPSRISIGVEEIATISGQVQGDSFSGTVTITTITTVGGIETRETRTYTTKWTNVPASDLRVQYDID